MKCKIIINFLLAVSLVIIIIIIIIIMIIIIILVFKRLIAKSNLNEKPL